MAGAGGASDGGEFVDGWLMGQALGEGAYGEVRLLVNARSGDSLALKSMRVSGGRVEGAAEAARKEAALHRTLRHAHVLRCHGSRVHQDMHYMFLEYCEGGELFDKIEPDVGMCVTRARRYFSQLLSGVAYLHSAGVAHRDIKPENLLLDAHDNLKISDFGMATVFRYKGTERLLSRRCGTLPYVGPEVLVGPYRAEAADLWSCGVVLVTMLAGELPWEQPSPETAEFALWSAGSVCATRPWSKLSPVALSLMRRLLEPEPARRLTLSQLLQHRWTLQPDHLLDENMAPNRSSGDRFSLSQPAATGGLSSHDATDGLGELSEPTMDALISFSQPTAVDDLLLSTQVPCTQASQAQNVFQRLVRRMTRFFVSLDLAAAMERLCTVLEQHNYQWKKTQNHVVSIWCSPCSRALPLVFQATALQMDGRVLLDFRLSRGCGLEFKRRFLGLRSALGDVVCKDVIAPSIIVTPMQC